MKLGIIIDLSQKPSAGALTAAIVKAAAEAFYHTGLLSQDAWIKSGLHTKVFQKGDEAAMGNIKHMCDTRGFSHYESGPVIAIGPEDGFKIDSICDGLKVIR